jgi:hypothetical protein
MGCYRLSKRQVADLLAYRTGLPAPSLILSVLDH